MSNPKIQIDDEVREMTNAEYAEYLANQAIHQELEAEQQAKIAARESALAKLAALGLTEAEIAAL
jgi:DNA-binding NarL/FixJ family response regulator